MNNDDKLREQMKSEPVPDRLKPENIKIMLDNEAPKKKRSGISMAGRIAAAAAACTVIGGTAAYSLNNGKLNKTNVSFSEAPASSSDSAKEEADIQKQASYMSGARNYDQVYNMFKAAADKYEEEREDEERYYKSDNAESSIAIEEYDGTAKSPQTNGIDGGLGSVADDTPEIPVIDGELPTEPNTEPDSEQGTEPATEPATEDTTEPTTEAATEEPKNDADPDHSETYYQEQDVLEADIVKTDGKRIYYIGEATGKDNIYRNYLRVADVKDGKFTGSTSIVLDDGLRNGEYLDITDMYVYNDMIAILGSNYYYSENCSEQRTFVSFYTTGDEPKLIDTYTQDGYFNDVRISPDGYMLLTSSYSTYTFRDINGSDEIKKYIPCYGMSKNFEAIEAEDILLPSEFDSSYRLDYTVIGSIDLNKQGSPEVRDIKTLAGHTGSIYCSADNLYSASGNWRADDTTDITRISIKGGNIEPQAACTINGWVNDQFSMSEYNGYFRVAATYTETKETFHRYTDDDGFIEGLWDRIKGESGGYYTYETIKKDNRVYVLDMDLNMVGSVEGLGINEEVKSASFSGNMAYIVTFRQTDPLYAVDLSDPANPVVLGELKINGFSTYMQPWGDGMLLGFGQDANDDGRITGLKLTMFDNSDPNNLKAVDTVTWDNEWLYDSDWNNREGKTESYFSSTALYERKALLIAPEKNIIGVPVQLDEYTYHEYSESDDKHTSQYVFFSFEDGKFVQKGDVTMSCNNWDYYERMSYFDRSIYIGDYVYTLAANKFVASDIHTFDITDELIF